MSGVLNIIEWCLKHSAYYSKEREEKEIERGKKRGQILSKYQALS